MALWRTEDFSRCDRTRVSIRLRLRYPARNRNTHLFLTNFALTLLDDLDQILLDRLLERARDLVGTLELLAFDSSHYGCEVVIVVEVESIV
jgi:hypothetical protein